MKESCTNELLDLYTTKSITLKNDNGEPTFKDLFAGIGGIRIVFKNAGSIG